HAFSLFAKVLLKIASGGKLIAGKAGDGIVLLIFGKHVALVIHDRNVVGLKTLDTVGDEKTNGGDRGSWQLTAALHLHENGSGGFALAIGEKAVFRHDYHHARGIDLVELA